MTATTAQVYKTATLLYSHKRQNDQNRKYEFNFCTRKPLLKMEELIISLQFFSLVRDVQNGRSVFYQFFKTENERVNSSRFCPDVKFDVVVLQNTSNKLNVLKCAPLVQYNIIVYPHSTCQSICFQLRRCWCHCCLLCLNSVNNF